MTDEDAVRRMGRQIRYHARRLGRCVGVVEDLEQEGRIGAVEAARRYDPECGVRFETYATSRVVGRMLDYLRACVSYLTRGQVAAGVEVRVVSLSAGRDGKIIDVAGRDVWSECDRAEMGAIVRAAVAELPTLARRLVRERLMGGYRAAACGLHTRQVRRLEAAAVDFLRIRLTGVAE
jgi:RNA polymerase sigma factor (sigma-70 family)